MSTPRRDNQFLATIVWRLKEIRNGRGVSQQRVTMDTGVNISRIESGNRMPSIYSLAILCKYYEVSMEEFFSAFSKAGLAAAKARLPPMATAFVP